MSISRPKITINVTDGSLGRVNAVGDGVAGLIIQMASAPTGHAFGEAKKYSSFESLPAELKSKDSCILFYTLAPGADLWIMPVITSTYTVADMVDKAHAQAYAKNLLAAAGGDIRFIAIDAIQAYSALATAITNAQALATDDTNGYNPVIVFLPVQYDSSLADLSSGSANRVGVYISETGRESGLLLGRLASTPVQRHIGRIKDGAMPITDAYIGTDKIEAGGTKITEVVDKGYITLGTIQGKSGYYYETQPLATDSEGDFATIANRRVIDKAVLIAYQTFLNELKDEIEIIQDGTIAPGVIKHYQGLIENAINQQMTASGNISGARAYMDPKQNVLSTSKLAVSLSILPLGYAEEIQVNIGFTTSLE